MRINIAGITAKCFACGNEDFVPLRPQPDAPGDRLACECCCSEVFYDDLRSQIGRSALAQRKLIKRLVSQPPSRLYKP
jgi:hypothetical protein